MSLDLDDLRAQYDPEVHTVPPLVGLAVSPVKAGRSVKTLIRAFFSSYDDDHRHYFSQILGQFPALDHHPDRALIVIREDTAYIHNHFPLSTTVIPKSPIPAHRFVFRNQIVEVTEVHFRDSVFEPDIRNGDKLVWLFRLGWSFGLYFDFSGDMRTVDLWGTLGQCYRSIDAHSTYSFLSRQDNVHRMIERGWFPFIQLSPDELRQLKHGIESESGMDAVEDAILGAFTPERIDDIASHWWNDPVYQKKRGIISAGLKAYNDGSDGQTINSIKNLSSEVEGILRMHYDREFSENPSTMDLKNYLKKRALQAFPHAASLAFPSLFFEYLDGFVFKSFNLRDGPVQLSRYSIAHGVADQERYTRTHALQLILSLDQICFYMMRTGAA